MKYVVLSTPMNRKRPCPAATNMCGAPSWGPKKPTTERKGVSKKKPPARTCRRH